MNVSRSRGFLCAIIQENLPIWEAFRILFILFFSILSADKDFCNKKIDWDYVINAVKDVYLEKESFDQYQECLKLMELFDYFYEKCIV